MLHGNTDKLKTSKQKMMNHKSTFLSTSSLLMALLILHSTAVHSFTITTPTYSPSKQSYRNHHHTSPLSCLFQSSSLSLSSQSNNNDNNNNNNTNDTNNNNVIATIDVSDLGLTMEDLSKPLPKELLFSIERSGYQSTSRMPDVNDNGCYWVENANNAINS